MSSTGSTDDTNETTALDLIEEQAEASIRCVWHDERGFFSIIDVIGLLTDSAKPSRYWTDMKRRLARDEGFIEVYAKCVHLKMRAIDGKSYPTDAADSETLLRIIQSVPSPKAEPVKQWLARVGAKRLEDVKQPLPASDVSPALVTIPKPAENAPEALLADYYERLASLYRRAAAYEARLEYVDAKLEELDGEISGIHDPLEGVEKATRLLPE